MSANKLVMNDDKTQFMISTKNKEKCKDVKVNAEPDDVVNSDNIKLFGVEIAADMKFNYFLTD